MDKARLLGANDYLFKPSNPLKLIDLVKSLDGVLARASNHERTLIPAQSV